MNWFRKKKEEYLYLFILPTISLDEKNKTSEDTIRLKTIEFIKGDLKKDKKEIKDTDIMVDVEAMQTYFIFVSDELKTNPFLRPIFYEIYAYKIKKDKTLFTYPFKTLLFNVDSMELCVLKFMIEC